MAEAPELRKTLAWMAVYWLLELGIQTAGTRHYHYFCDASFCYLVQEFDLMEEDRAEYMKHFGGLPCLDVGLPGFDGFKAAYDKKYGLRKKR
jgi:hypothetical protein